MPATIFHRLRRLPRPRRPATELPHRAGVAPLRAVQPHGVLLGAVIVGLAIAAGAARADDEPDPRQAIKPGLVPFVPAAVSRPDGWPGSAAGRAVADALEEEQPGVAAAVPPADDAARAAADGAVNAERHVLSSIRQRPGGPLRIRDEGVVQANYDEPAGGPAARRSLPEPVLLEGSKIMARVGPEVVLESDLLTPKALDWLAQVTPGLPPEQVRELRMQICRQVIDQHVETLLVYVDACREIPADKLPEVRRNVDKSFDEQMLPNLIKEAKAANTLDYDQQLKARGQSLDSMRKMFFERGLAQEWLRKNVETGEEIPHAEMIASYQSRLADYDFPAKARFEALTVKTGLKRSRQDAWDILATMGNEVLAGRPFAEVARARSEGPTARDGGRFDWTSRGSLASKLLDEAVFSLPIGQLSTILEDDTGLHIVRVTERLEAGRTPFIEAQTGIREALREERRERLRKEYLARLRARTPVWTIFDAPAGGQAITASRPASGPTR